MTVSAASDEQRIREIEAREAIQRALVYVPRGHRDLDGVWRKGSTYTDAARGLDDLLALLRVREQEAAEAKALAHDLIGYSGLRDKVRLREDATEYEEAERLIARFDARIRAVLAVVPAAGEEGR